MTEIQLEQVLPEKIEERSFAIISDELGKRGIHLEPENELVIKRAIHTTADFDYASSLVISPDAVRLGIRALEDGAVIVTDTNMAMAGINKRKLEGLGGQVLCFMADEDVAEAAKRRQSTRAVASMEKAARLLGTRPVIFAIGNAPTALVELCRLMDEKQISPALIVGVPVGFVNVEASKELVIGRKDVPYIVARGRKGGSNVAAAIINAMLYQTKNEKG